MKEILVALHNLPPETLVWRTISKSFTASDLVLEIESGSESGRQFVSDVLRFSVDYIKRQASKCTKS